MRSGRRDRNCPSAGAVCRPDESASLSTAILTDWKDRFIKAYDVELQAFINDVKAGQLHGPSAWDGYAASVAADACIKAQGTSEPVEVTLPECPAFYKR